MKKASFTFKENKREHEVSTWTHTISRKKKSEYEITNAWPWHQLLGQHKKDYFGLPWRRRQLSVWHNSSVCPHAQSCCGVWGFVSIDVSFILSFIPSLSHLLSLLKHSSKISESWPSGKHHGQFHCSYLFNGATNMYSKNVLSVRHPTAIRAEKNSSEINMWTIKNQWANVGLKGLGIDWGFTGDYLWSTA